MTPEQFLETIDSDNGMTVVTFFTYVHVLSDDQSWWVHDYMEGADGIVWIDADAEPLATYTAPQGRPTFFLKEFPLPEGFGGTQE